jgi:hypothetical protein
MHTALRGVPALVLSCDADVLADPSLKDGFRRKVAAYVAFIKVGLGFRVQGTGARGSVGE